MEGRPFIKYADPELRGRLLSSPKSSGFQPLPGWTGFASIGSPDEGVHFILVIDSINAYYDGWFSGPMVPEIPIYNPADPSGSTVGCISEEEFTAYAQSIADVVQSINMENILQMHGETAVYPTYGELSWLESVKQFFGRLVDVTDPE